MRNPTFAEPLTLLGQGIDVFVKALQSLKVLKEQKKYLMKIICQKAIE